MVLPLFVSVSLGCLHADAVTGAPSDLPKQSPEALCGPYFKPTSKAHLLIYSQTFLWVWLHDGYHSRLGDVLVNKTNHGAPLKKHALSPPF